MNHSLTRRDLLQRTAGVVAGLAAGELLAEPQPPEPIIDAHVHVWNLEQFQLPWLHQDPLLHRDYSIDDYRKAAEGLNVASAVYVEVNVEPRQRVDEAENVVRLCGQADPLFSGGVIAGDPKDPEFSDYLDRFQQQHAIKGVRCYYPKSASSDDAFLHGIKVLGEKGLSFDLQLGPPLLADAAELVQKFPQTHFILNHCGGITPRAFRPDTPNNDDARQTRDAWRRGIAALSSHPNAWCKISGVADEALPGDATAQDVAPIVNFCLDHFAPDRVLFGGNWPVCLKGCTLAHWVQTLRSIVSKRSAADQRQLFHDNCKVVYRLS
jgi:predicted TIM-barrel fold metal-dependent hydrolase